MGKDKENACRHTSVSTVAPASLVGAVERSGSRLHTMAWSREQKKDRVRFSPRKGISLPYSPS